MRRGGRGARARAATRPTLLAPALLVAIAVLTVACSSSTDDAATAGPVGETSAAGTTLPVGNADVEAATTNAELAITVASSRPEHVTGGDTLVQLTVPPRLSAATITVTAEATGETFEVSGNDGRGNTVARVSGLPLGPSTITARANGDTASVEVVNHPITGPLFSGPHLPMVACSTALFDLGAPVDEHCSAPTAVRWSYRSTDGTLKPLPDPTARPDDLATIGDTAKPFIVRDESGTINRGVYWITVLDPEPNPTTQRWDDSAWNGRLVYEFGGGCGTSYSQGFRLMGPPDLDLLEDGYAFASNTLNTFQVMCNDVLSAETVSMVKERFVEAYGLPKFTIGSGGSGGAIQQYLIAQNYPGLLDGVAAALPFPDAVTTAMGVVDCALLERYYAGEGAELDDTQRTAINGHLTSRTCGTWNQTFAPAIDPDESCLLGVLAAASALIGIDGRFPTLPEEAIYDADTNPDGLRCTLQDTNVHQLGTDPETGFARRPWDNVGVQYGLGALNDGVISTEEFLDVNEAIGSFDIDGNPVPERSDAGEDLAGHLYRTGRVVDGSGGLRRIPVVTIDVFTDDQGDIHDRYRAFALRDRLRLDDGTDPANHVIWTRELPEGQNLAGSLAGTLRLGAEAIEVIDEWLTALAADTTSDPVEVRLERARPDAAVDNCITGDGERITGVDVYEPGGACAERYPVSADTRIVAGAPLANDIVKCRLQTVAEAIDAGVYSVELSADDRARLEAIFPDGVCDYTRPGVGQGPVEGDWLSYPR